MMSVSIFTDVVDKDQLLDLLTYYQERNKCTDIECTEDNMKMVLEKLIDEIDMLFDESVEDNDAGGILNSIVSLIILMNPDEQQLYVEKLCSKLEIKMECNEKKYATKHAALKTLYLGLNAVPLKYRAYIASLNEEINNEKKHLLNIKLDDVERWIKDNKQYFEPSHIQSIYRKLHTIFQGRSDKNNSTYTMIQLLGAFNLENAASAKEDAIECILTAIQDPNNMTLYQLLDLAPVQSMKHEPLYELLEIFVKGTLKDFNSFMAKHEKDIKEKYALDMANCEKKMRVLTLMEMAAGRDITELPYSTLCQELEMESDDRLEAFIIEEAVRQNVVSCKLDQYKSRVLIDGVIPRRTFGQQEWERLGDDLLTWRDNLESVVGFLEKMRGDRQSS